MIELLSLMTGVDIPVKEIPLIIHQPTIKEISYFGEQRFLETLQLLCIKKENFTKVEDEGLLESINNFQLFMEIINHKDVVEKKENVKQFLSMIILGDQIILAPRSIIVMVKKPDNSYFQAIIDENNFSYLQEALRIIFCVGQASDSFNPEGSKAQEIARKLQRGRERVAAQHSTGNKSIFAQYISVLTIGINSMSFEDVLKLTLFQFYDLIERYGLYISWDIDIRSRLAGADIKKEPDNWMKPIH